MKYSDKDNRHNHVILPGREGAFFEFVNKKFNGKNYKWKNSHSSNSEDALTWSCFDILSQLPFSKKITALDDIIEHSFAEKYQSGEAPFKFHVLTEKDLEINICKDFTGANGEITEVDASIETLMEVVFFENKLYSSISLKDKTKPHDQIIRKLRIGLQYALKNKKTFYFIFLDIAPPKKLLAFSSTVKSKENAENSRSEKWKSAWWFNYYKKGRNNSKRPLREQLEGIDYMDIEIVSKNMGWLTWSDLFKIVMSGMINTNFS